jgi:hypothetical protein
MYVFANLSQKPITPSASDLILKKKTLKGLWAEEVYELNVFKLLEMKHQVTSMLDNEFRTEVQNTYPLENYKEAFEAYLSNQSGGKVQFIIGDAEAVPVRVCTDGKAATGLPILPTENKRKANDVFGQENQTTTTGKDDVLGNKNKTTTAGHVGLDALAAQNNQRTDAAFGQTGYSAGYTELNQTTETTDTTTKPLPSSSQWLESYKASDPPGTVPENSGVPTDPLPSSPLWLESYKASDPPVTGHENQATTTTTGNYPGYTDLNQQNQTSTTSAYPSSSQYTAGQSTTGTYQDLKVKEEKDKHVIL